MRLTLASLSGHVPEENQVVMSIEKSDALLAYLASHGVEQKTYEHPAVHTVEESRKLRGDIPGLHTKNLFLRDGKKNFYLFVTDESATVSLKALAKKIGAKGGLSFGSAEALRELLGIEPGSVSLLALINDPDKRVTVVFDEALKHADTINCHPLANTRTTSLSRDAVAAFLATNGRAPIYASLTDADSGE